MTGQHPRITDHRARPGVPGHAAVHRGLEGRLAAPAPVPVPVTTSPCASHTSGTGLAEKASKLLPGKPASEDVARGRPTNERPRTGPYGRDVRTQRSRGAQFSSHSGTMYGAGSPSHGTTRRDRSDLSSKSAIFPHARFRAALRFLRIAERVCSTRGSRALTEQCDEIAAIFRRSRRFSLTHDLVLRSVFFPQRNACAGTRGSDRYGQRDRCRLHRGSRAAVRWAASRRVSRANVARWSSIAPICLRSLAFFLT